MRVRAQTRTATIDSNRAAMRIRWLGLFLGPALAVGVYLLVPEADGPGTDGLSPAGRATAAVAAWMACWWLTEAAPLPVTAMLPLVLFPLTGAGSIAEAAAPYSRPLIFFFLGGFLIGLSLERWGLHRRIALLTVLAVGTEPVRLIGGFMVATAFLSMWISNTATVIMLLPIAVSVVEMFKQRSKDAGKTDLIENFATALMLGIAYAASIGGLGTLIGSPPNLVLAAFVQERYGVDVTMVDWLKVGLPVVLVMLPLTWLYLTRLAFPVRLRHVEGGRALIVTELQKLGPMSRGEWTVLVVFALTALGWITRPLLVRWTGLTGLTDPVIAMTGGLSLFVIPVKAKEGVFAMDLETAKKLPWGILLLFGGGLSLASTVARNGVDVYLASGFMGLEGTPMLLFLLALTIMVVFMTEITSNTAVTTTLMPVLAATATALNMEPGVILTAAALAASCAFMLPVATPPNAIVFSSGFISIAQMVRAGIWLNLLAVVVISFLVSYARLTVPL